VTAKPLAEALEDVLRGARDIDASLNERLAVVADAVRALSPPFADAVDRLVNRLQRNSAGSAAPRAGDLMPPFLLPDDTGHLVSLEEVLETGPAAVVFHRGHWCPYCRLSTDALARLHETVQASCSRIIAIMPDRQKFALKLKSETRAPFPILTDIDNGYALSLNLAIWVGQEMQSLLAAGGRNLPEYQGNDAWMVPIPATFVVGRNGRISERFVDPDYRKRVAIEELQNALERAA